MSDLRRVINKHGDVFSNRPGMAKFEGHKITVSTNKPIVTRPHKIPFLQRPKVSQELKEMEKNGIIRRSDSPYSSAIVIVQKKDLSLRICPDYRKLNKITVFDPEPMNTSEDIINNMNNSKSFT